MNKTLLSTALKNVPELGFRDALLASVRSHGYSDAALSLFPRKEYDLVEYHLTEQRNQLANIDVSECKKEISKVGKLINHRLEANNLLGSRMKEYLTILSRYPKSSLTSLHELSDDIWYYAGDRSIDFSWYTRRALLSSIYASAEIYQSQGLPNVDKFVDNRLKELDGLEKSSENTTEWLKFNGYGMVNVIRSFTR